MELPDRFFVAAGTDCDFLDEPFMAVHAVGIVAIGRPIRGLAARRETRCLILVAGVCSADIGFVKSIPIKPTR